MFEVLDEKLNIRVLNLDTDPTAYYLSFKGSSKVVIDVKYVDEDALFNISLQEDCNADEINIILDKFTKYFLDKNENINGVKLMVESNEMLDNIGFKQLDNEFLYRERNRKIKR